MIDYLMRYVFFVFVQSIALVLNSSNCCTRFENMTLL